MREFTANEIAQAIINSQLEEQAARKGAVQPDPYYLPNFPSEPTTNFDYKVPNDPLLQQLWQRQMYGPKSGGRT